MKGNSKAFLKEARVFSGSISDAPRCAIRMGFMVSYYSYCKASTGFLREAWRDKCRRRGRQQRKVGMAEVGTAQVGIQEDRFLPPFVPCGNPSFQNPRVFCNRHKFPSVYCFKFPQFPAKSIPSPGPPRPSVLASSDLIQLDNAELPMIAKAIYSGAPRRETAPGQDEVGFQSLPHFNRTFHNKLGQTPTRYRSQLWRRGT